jgi:hypothetical protein
MFGSLLGGKEGETKKEEQERNDDLTEAYFGKKSGVSVGMWDLFRPWRLTVDTGKKRITAKKRNWHLINVSETSYNYQSVGDVAINKNIFSADIAISVYSGQAVTPYSVVAYRISKGDAKRISDLLLDGK